MKTLVTKRIDGSTLQDLEYTYDPVGNIMRIKDDSVKTIYYDQQKIEAV